MMRCLVYFILISLLSFPAGRIMPKGWIVPDGAFFRVAPGEKPIYERLGIRYWQKKLPDMSRLFPGLMPPKSKSGLTPELLPMMVRETCVAELTHTGLILLGWLWPFAHAGVFEVVIALLYTLGNLPFVMIQRYNRPRLLRLQQRWEKEERAHAYADSELQHRRRA